MSFGYGTESITTQNYFWKMYVNSCHFAVSSCGLNRNGPHRFLCLNAWSLVDRTVGESLASVDLLEMSVPGGGFSGFKSHHCG